MAHTGRCAALDDGVLIGRAQAGELDAYDELVRRYQEVAFRTALVITGDPDEAEDAAQSAFIKAYRALARFDADRPFRPWLLTIVGNEARNRRIAAGRRHRLLTTWQATLDATALSSPEQETVARDEAATVLAALSRLKPEDREIIDLRYIAGLSEREMAATLGCAAGTVKSRLHRAMGRLRAVAREAGLDLPAGGGA